MKEELKTFGMRIFTAILLVLFVQSLSAVNAVADEENDLDDKTGKIRGTIVDKATQEPMAYASIAIFSQLDSALISGGITNDKGEFEITDLDFGEFYLEAQFIGFEKVNVPNLNITRKTSPLDVGTINLATSTIALNEVNVVADKAPIEYKLDKKVVNVSQVISAIGGTAVDVLENTPSVQVDIEGNVSLRGSGNFTVLIDGRPSVLSGSDALRQIPSSAIENIEIITNPSAKYEPDGTAGIINLVMKKNSLIGLNGIINASVGTGNKYKGDFMLNYRREKVNWFIGADWRDENDEGKIFSNRETYKSDTTDFLTMQGLRDSERSGYNFKGGADFYLSDNTTLTLSGEIGNSKRATEGEGTTEQFSRPPGEHIYSVNEEVSERENDFYSLNANFQHKFNDKGHRLEATVFYSDENGTDTELEEEILADEDFNKKDEYLDRVLALETEDETDFRFKLDYTNPYSEDGNFEAGLQSRVEREFEELDFRDFDQESGDWIINDDFSSATDFSRDIHAIYSTFSNKWGSFEYMAGLRGELTLREIQNTKAEEASSLNRFDFFPTAHMSYPVTKKADLTGSYSRRINRPSGRDLDPTPTYYSQYAIRIGNPDLEPEYTNSFELGALQRFGTGRSFLSADIFHRVTNNKIDRTAELGEDGVIYYYTDNFDKDYSTGVEVTGNLSHKEWLLLNASVNVYRYRVSGELDGEAIDRKSTNWGGRLNATFKIADNSRFQATAFFRGPSVTAQGESKAMFFSNFSYRHEFFRKKLSATLSWRDPFGTARFERELYGPNFTSDFRYEREPRVLFLTLSYKLNNFKEQRRGGAGQGGGMDMGGGEF